MNTSSTQDTTTILRPRIYVASLSDYNAGNLHGVWMDAAQDIERIQEEVSVMLAASPEPGAEEWAIHDYEGFGGLRLDEYTDLKTVAEIACLIVEHGEVFAGLLAHFGGTSGLEEAREYMEHGYCGAYDNTGWYAAQLCDDLYQAEMKALPDFIRNNIDWDAIGRDLEMGGDIFIVEIGREVYVFDAHI